MKIVADSDIPFLRGVFEPCAEVVWLRGDEIAARDVRDADALLVRTRTRCDSGLLSGSQVRFIGTATIGFDHIDMEWCAARGIEVATAAGCNRRGVLQWVAAALAWLAAEQGIRPERSRKIPTVGKFKQALTPPEITLGVVGVGNVGSLVASYAESWGFRVMLSDPPRERAEGLGTADGFHPLEELVSRCDVLTFHVPLTASGHDATRGMVGRDFLSAMKPGAVVINSSRGAIIEQQALIGSIEQGRPSPYFIIDTWNGEPDIDRRVLDRALLATPHIAGYSVQGKATATSMVVNSLARAFGVSLQGIASKGHDVQGDDWYPEGALRSEARAIGWEEMCASMPSYFDIAAESSALKTAPEQFEQMRNNYRYREEFF